MDITVSICCLVYNHEKYLRKTLEGFVRQKVNFAYEIIIHDDASTDGSAAIIREYCEKYPGLFRPILQTENQYCKRIGLTKTFIYPLIRGQFVAMCEGDDYWCDENKLQLQVDYMEAHPECSMCIHDTAFIDMDGNYLGKCFNGFRRDRDYTAKQAIRAAGSGYLGQTSSFFARKSIMTERPDTFNIRGIGDLPQLLYAAVNGPIHYIGRVMSCYRIGDIDSWSVRNNNSSDRFVQQKEREYEDLTRIDQQTDHQYAHAFAVLRGLRLSQLYRKHYGIKALLKNPSHLFMVLRAHSYTFPKKILKKFKDFRAAREQFPLWP